MCLHHSQSLEYITMLMPVVFSIHRTIPQNYLIILKLKEYFGYGEIYYNARSFYIVVVYPVHITDSVN